MRISLLLRREPFGSILEQTLAGYLKKRYGYPHQVVWRQKGHTVAFKSQKWLCNPYLNIIFHPDILPEPLQPAIYEFSRSAKPWRTPLNMLYVSLATARTTSRFLANAVIEIDPPLPHAEHLVIIGGNHHIRLLDYHDRSCAVITKHGFNIELMRNDLAVRTTHEYLPTPRITSQADDDSWYREELILGTPVNRLKDRNKALIAVQQVSSPLFRLYEATGSVFPRICYVESIHTNINTMLCRNRVLCRIMRDRLMAVTGKLSRMASNHNINLFTVQAHGDFQPANILAGDGGTWLIDWEYSVRRQSGYDGLVFALNSKQSERLTSRVHAACDNALPNNDILDGWPGLEWHDRSRRSATLALFMLEELELKLRENDNLNFIRLDPGFLSFCSEVEHIIALLDQRN